MANFLSPTMNFPWCCIDMDILSTHVFQGLSFAYTKSIVKECNESSVPVEMSAPHSVCPQIMFPALLMSSFWL